MLKQILVVILAVHCASSDQAYEHACPTVNPMSDFDMEKFIGVWYLVQPDFADKNAHDIPSCEYYNVTRGQEANKFVVNTLFELYTQFDGDVPLQYESISTSRLTSFNENAPAMMSITPTLGSHVFESNFTVFNTDYETYAIISNCDKEINDGELQFTQHATLWSRTRDLSESFVEKLYESLGEFDFDPYDLTSDIQTGCIEGGKKIVRVNLDNDEIIP